MGAILPLTSHVESKTEWMNLEFRAKLNMNYCLVLKIKFIVLQISVALQDRNTAL